MPRRGRQREISETVNRLRYFLLAAFPLAAVWLYAVSESAAQLRSLIEHPVQRPDAPIAATRHAVSEPAAVAAHDSSGPAAPAGTGATSEDREASNGHDGEAVAHLEIHDSDILPLLDEYLVEADGQETQEILEAIAEFVYPSNRGSNGRSTRGSN
jgi:hypothetical protein